MLAYSRMVLLKSINSHSEASAVLKLHCFLG